MKDNYSISILGAGWLGEPLGEVLAKHGYVVKGSTTHPDKLEQLANKGIQPYLLSVTDQLEGKNIEAFFQSDLLIINIPPGRRQPDVEQRFPTQIRLILDTAETAGVAKYLFVSSTSVYGNQAGLLTEQHPAQPVTGSGKALLQCEKFLRQHLADRLTILRLAGLVGGQRRPGRWFAGKKELPNGNAPVNMVHRQDVIEVIRRIINGEHWGHLLNVCADEHPPKHLFYPHQAKKDQLEPPTYVSDPRTDYKTIDNTTVKRLLDFQFSYSDPMQF